ncbi:unnamed protein product [Arabidopsis lyrata]|nr:unnamed protein product [Arabidopsis lyrata]
MGFPLSSFPTVLLASLGRRLPPGSPLESPLPPEPPDPPDLSSSQISFWGFTSFPLTVRNFEPPLTDFPPLFNSPPLAQFVVMKSSRLTIRTMTVALYLVSSGGTPFAFISGFRFYQWMSVHSRVRFADMNEWIVFKTSVVFLPWMCLDFLYHCYSFMEVYVLLFSPFGGISCNVGKKIFTGIFRWLTISSLRGMDWCVSNVSEDPLFNSYVDAAWTALFAETLAVELALLDAQSAGFHKLKVFSVCKVLISLLISGTSTVAPRSLLHDIRELSVSFTLICFYFVSRLETVIAESLAISALSDVIPFSSVWR